MTEKSKSKQNSNIVQVLKNQSLILLLSIPIAILAGFQHYSGTPIKNQSQLDSLVILESNKLSLNPKNIHARFGECPGPRTAGTHKLNNENYEIILDGFRSQYTLKHELYHIYDNDCEKKGYNLFERLIDEVQANFYSTTGIKISLK